MAELFSDDVQHLSVVLCSDSVTHNGSFSTCLLPKCGCVYAAAAVVTCPATMSLCGSHNC